MLFTIRLAINSSHSQENEFVQFDEHSLGRDTDTDWSASVRVLGSHQQFLLVRPTFACEVGFMWI